MSEEEKPIIKKVQPYVATKFLVSSVNTFLGHLLVSRLRNEIAHPENPNRILGTVCQAEADTAVPDGIRKVIDVTTNLCRQGR